MLVCLMLAAGVAAQAIELDDCRVSWCEEFVTMRASPSTSARALVRIPYGQMVHNVRCDHYSDCFYRCSYNGYTGYVLSEYLLGGQEMAEIDPAYVVNCKEWVSLRFRPNTGSQQLIKVPKGAEVLDAYYVENGFVHCFYKGYEGYILERYIGRRR